MRKAILIIAIGISIPNFAQNSIKKTIVEEKGFAMEVKFVPILEKQSIEQLEVAITPVSPEDLDKEFFIEVTTSGSHRYVHYEKSRSSFFLTRKGDKKPDEFLLYQALEKLLGENKITKEIFDRAISALENKPYDSDLQLISGNRSNHINPFYIGERSLSVFKVDISNSTNAMKRFDIQFHIIDGDYLILPLTISELEILFLNNNMSSMNKSLLLNKFYLPNSIDIPANTSVSKYFASVPLSYSSRDLKIVHNKASKSYEWKVEYATSKIDKTFIYYNFVVELTWSDFPTPISLGIITQGKEFANYSSESILIDEEHLDDNIEIFLIGVGDKQDVYYTLVSIKGRDYINFEKKKRSIIKLKADKIRIDD